ncbi:MAG: tetratricopeptide repeat protein [Pseudoxanthomonas sp.]
MLLPASYRLRLALSAFACALVTLFVYWPGLYGGFVFDDMPFVFENPALQLENPGVSDIVRAAMSFPAQHQGRWLTMLTFAANSYLGGMNPSWMKLTNLGIHLLNGLLLFLALRWLLRLFRLHFKRQDLSDAGIDGLALAISALWLVLPINLTAVLYVVQRLESFSNTFVLLGLYLYLKARTRLGETGKGLGKVILALVACTAVGCLAKESAILLPAYTACVEFCLLSSALFRTQQRRIFALYGSLLLLPLATGLYWLSTWIGTENSYPRDFTTAERLMTQARVWLHYIQWSLLPLPDSLTLYHDDFPVSRGLLQPWTTLASIVGLAALLGLALWQRAKRPLFSLGILWFFTGHLLTGTVIPLEMVFEHRNYFPSIGLLLSLVTLIAIDPVHVLRRRALVAIFLLGYVFYGGTTLMRAVEWGDPIRLAVSESTKRPDSPRAQLELARILVIGAEGSAQSAPLLAQAEARMRHCMALPQSSVVCESGLILLAARAGRAAEPDVWNSIVRKFETGVPAVSDAEAMKLLIECHLKRKCPDQSPQLARAMKAAMDGPRPHYLMISVNAGFASNMLRDYAMAEANLREVVRQLPNNSMARTNLIRFLIARSRFDEAAKEVDALQPLNVFGSLDNRIEMLRAEIETARRKPSTAPPEAQASSGKQP